MSKNLTKALIFEKENTKISRAVRVDIKGEIIRSLTYK